MNGDVEIRSITAEESRPVRHAVLRPGRPLEELIYAEDDAADTLHVGGFVESELVAVARVSREPPPWGADGDAWRLRGMATVPEHRDAGVGSRLLARCVEHAASRGGTLVWCNARVRAQPFYERAGFRPTGEPFDVPGIGPHVMMVRELR